MRSRCAGIRCGGGVGADDDNVVNNRRLTVNTKDATILFQKGVRVMATVVFVPCVFLVWTLGCSPKPSEPHQIVSVTRPVGSWQGRGTVTVGDIPSETGRFRITWETTNESPAGSGRFKLTLRSAISGRTLGIVADHAGTGTGTAEYDEGHRTYDFLVESAAVDWPNVLAKEVVLVKGGAMSPGLMRPSPGRC